ncbi:hypothetical protein B0I35DRAFT_478425 [Stachybotrys elegans]|uniref:Uncharacterized protein n=1 Tax=Stachybotrys elegans TaxID=80388 RepID=A0A8K0WS32_9HYPO|nr:hypothetical protein B0I35DRAFT_478425 [Stachybotrys elegans]
MADRKLPRLNLEYSVRTGGTIPCFACSAKPRIRDMIGLEDFLGVGEMPGSTSGRPDGSWWLRFRDLAAQDRHRWIKVQTAMASDNGCLVEIKSKPGTGWSTVPSERDSLAHGKRLREASSQGHKAKARRVSRLRHKIEFD